MPNQLLGRPLTTGGGGGGGGTCEWKQEDLVCVCKGERERGKLRCARALMLIVSYAKDKVKFGQRQRRRGGGEAVDRNRQRDVKGCSID